MLVRIYIFNYLLQVPVSRPPSPLLNLFIQYQYGGMLIGAFKAIGLIHELTESSTGMFICTHHFSNAVAYHNCFYHIP